MTSPVRVIWTRDAGDEKAPDGVLHLPCIATEAVTPEWRLGGFDHVVFSSAKAVQTAMASPRLRPAIATLPGHAFGTQTAAAMTAAGLTVQLHDAKSAEELATLLSRQLPAGARIALPGPKEPAFDLAGALNAAGYQAEAIACYKTTPQLCGPDGRPLTPTDAVKLAATLNGVVCFLSPSAVSGFVDGFAAAMPQLRTKLTAVAIGGTTAAAATPHFKTVTLAPQQSAEAVLAAAHALVKNLIQTSSI